MQSQSDREFKWTLIYIQLPLILYFSTFILAFFEIISYDEIMGFLPESRFIPLLYALLVCVLNVLLFLITLVINLLFFGQDLPLSAKKDMIFFGLGKLDMSILLAISSFLYFVLAASNNENVDFIYVLIIVGAIVYYYENKIKVNVPSISISINKDMHFYVNGNRVDESNLEKEIVKIAERNLEQEIINIPKVPDNVQTIIIQWDNSVDDKHVIKVMDIAHRNKYNYIEERPKK